MPSSDERKIERILENVNNYYECMHKFCTPATLIENWHIVLMVEKAVSSLSASIYDVELPIRELNELREGWYTVYAESIPSEP